MKDPCSHKYAEVTSSIIQCQVLWFSLTTTSIGQYKKNERAIGKSYIEPLRKKEITS